MHTIDNQNIRIIPAAFYAFFLESRKYKEKVKYSKTQGISEDAFVVINEIISQNNKKQYIGIDMLNIYSYPMHIFTNLYMEDDKVFFFNIKEETVRLRLQEDLPALNWLGDEVAYISESRRLDIERLITKDCKDANQRNIIRIINDIMLETDNSPYLLASSGMYSNCYLSVKKLFTKVEDFYYIIFALADVLIQNDGVDALVTSSKNGAVLATILGDLLNIKEVHLLGVGPKYSMELGDSVNCIKEGKRYIYIFDFLCTGTELKVVSALINSRKGLLQGAVGISRFKEEIGLTLHGDIRVLAESGIFRESYVLAGSRDSIIKLKELEKYD